MTIRSRTMPLRKYGISNTFNSIRINDNIRNAFTVRKLRGGKRASTDIRDYSMTKADMRYNGYTCKECNLNMASHKRNTNIRDPYSILEELNE